MTIYIPGSEGYLKRQIVEYCETRAKGGVDLIIVISTYVKPHGVSQPNQTAITRNKYIPGLKICSGGTS